MKIVTGQVVKVQTTADECIRITVDVDLALVPEGVNMLKWKNNMISMQVNDEG